MSTQRTFTLLEAAEFAIHTCDPTDWNMVQDTAFCLHCYAQAKWSKDIVHIPDCPYAAALRAIEKARKQPVEYICAGYGCGFTASTLAELTAHQDAARHGSASYHGGAKP